MELVGLLEIVIVDGGRRLNSSICLTAAARMCSGLVKDATAASLDHRPRCCVLDLAALSCFGRNVIIFSRCRRQWKAHGSWRSVPAAAPVCGPCRAALEELRALRWLQGPALSEPPSPSPNLSRGIKPSDIPIAMAFHAHSIFTCCYPYPSLTIMAP